MQYITDSKQLADFCTSIASEPILTIDTEFLRGPCFYPKLCLIQIAGETQQAIIDPLCQGIDLSPLEAILCSEHHLKVFHSGKQDVETILHHLGYIVTPVFDTQIAAMVCGHGSDVSYANLVRRYCQVELDKSLQFMDWSKRPLSDAQKAYAISDVTHLRTIFFELQTKLQTLGRSDWIKDETERLCDQTQYQPDLESLWHKFYQPYYKADMLARLKALTIWRETQAMEQDVPRSRLLQEGQIVDLCLRFPKTLDEIGRTKALRLSTRYRKEVLEVLANAPAINKDEVPSYSQHAFIKEHKGQVDLLKLLLKIKAQEYDVVEKIIASASDLTALLYYYVNGKEEENCRLLKDWRYETFGQSALALLKGQIAITMRHDKMAVVGPLTG